MDGFAKTSVSDSFFNKMMECRKKRLKRRLKCLVGLCSSCEAFRNLDIEGGARGFTESEKGEIGERGCRNTSAGD